MAIGEFSKGEVSEWNEGNFKSLRLHLAQDLINRAIINPFQQSGEGGGKFNYEIWIDAIKILLGEGMSKYSDSEYLECSGLKTAIEKILAEDNPCSIKKTYNNGKYNRAILVKKDKWNKLKTKIEEFEYKVKSYNDKHGLSTRNVGTKGLFG